MKNIICSYIRDEKAVDEAVSKMIFIVLGITCAMALGWWVWNILQSRTEQSNCANSNSPWCVE